jgi:hypothetical protein
MEARARKALGCFVLLADLALFTIGAATLAGALLPRAPAWAQLVFFAVAGIVWIAPLRPLFAWMNRAPRGDIAGRAPRD